MHPGPPAPGPTLRVGAGSLSGAEERGDRPAGTAGDGGCLQVDFIPARRHGQGEEEAGRRTMVGIDALISRAYVLASRYGAAGQRERQVGRLGPEVPAQVRGASRGPGMKLLQHPQPERRPGPPASASGLRVRNTRPVAVSRPMRTVTAVTQQDIQPNEGPAR